MKSTIRELAPFGKLTEKSSDLREGGWEMHQLKATVKESKTRVYVVVHVLLHLCAVSGVADSQWFVGSESFAPQDAP